MKEYKDVYHFEVLDAIAEGKKVTVVDRKEGICFDCSTMNVSGLLRMVKSEEKGRFKFWYISEIDNEVKAV